MMDASGTTTWDYDSRGRVTKETKAITGSGNTFLTQWGYNSADLVTSMTYPGGNGGQAGEVVNYTYYKQMTVDTVIGTSTYVYDTQYEAEGRVDYRKLGSSPQVQQNYVYNAWTTDGGRLSQILSGLTTDTDSLQDLRYTYDDVGNVLTIKDYKDMTGSDPQTQTFTYDALNRLASARAQYGSYGTYALENYTYDANGNLWTKAGVSYTYLDGAHKHAVSHLGGVQKYWYDANGNQTTRIMGGNTYNLSYDGENRLTAVSGYASATFVYDGDGNRVKGTAAGVTTYYIGNYFEWTGSTSTMKKYYYAGGERIAMRTGASTVNYLLSDHLGSNAVVADTIGIRSSEVRYKPWGEDRYNYNTSPTSFRFTGQRVEASIGLYYYGARWYDASLGRFISADTIVPNPGDPSSFDRYMYAAGNPIRYNDPTGHWYYDPACDCLVDTKESGNEHPENLTYLEPAPGISMEHHRRLRMIQRQAEGLSLLVQSGEISDVEALARLMDFAAPLYDGKYSTELFLTDLGIVVGGFDPALLERCQIGVRDCTRLEQYYVDYPAFDPEDTGFKYIYNPDDENQVRHFLAGASGSANYGSLGEAYLLDQELSDVDDRLYGQAFAFVDYLLSDGVTLSDAGDWVRFYLEWHPPSFPNR